MLASQAGRIICLALLALLILLFCACDQTMNFYDTPEYEAYAAVFNPPLVIADLCTLSVFVPVHAKQGYTIGEVRLKLAIDHDNLQDLFVIVEMDSTRTIIAERPWDENYFQNNWLTTYAFYGKSTDDYRRLTVTLLDLFDGGEGFWDGIEAVIEYKQTKEKP